MTGIPTTIEAELEKQLNDYLDDDINVAIKYSPDVKCVRCGYQFKLARRCPECGQLYEYVEY